MRTLFPLMLAALTLLTAAPACAVESERPPPGGTPVVIGQSYTLRSTVLGQTRRINVYLPASYAADPKRRFPVLYLLDGGIKEDFHAMSGLASIGIYNRAQDVIVVGIEEINRQHDFTYASSDPADVKLVPTQGGSAAFRRFIGEELQPYVAAHWRTNGDRGVVGESLAALFIVETFLKQPTLFDRYIAISPSLWWDKGALVKDADKRIADLPPGERWLYLSIGEEAGTMHDAMTSLAAALKAGAPPRLHWSFDPLPDEAHSTIYHRAAQRAFRVVYPAKAL